MHYNNVLTKGNGEQSDLFIYLALNWHIMCTKVHIISS